MNNDNMNNNGNYDVRAQITDAFKMIEVLKAQKEALKDLVLAKLLTFEVAEIERHVASLEALVSSETAMREMYTNGAKPRKPCWLKFQEELAYNAKKRAKKNEKEPSSNYARSVDDELDEIKGLASRNHAQ